MFANLELLRLSGAMAAHAGTRQAMIAGNIAHADTPGYRARDLPSFAETISRQDQTMRATRAAHLNGTGTPAQSHRAVERADKAADPNGNTVMLEEEMQHAVAVKRQHDRAIAIYRSTMSILRSTIGR